MVRPRGTGPAASRSGVRCRLPGRTCGSAVTGNGPPRPLRDSVGARTGRAPVAVRSPRRPPRRQGTRPDGGPRGPRRTARRRAGPTGRTESRSRAFRRGLVDVALASVMRDALLRRSEAAALTWADVESRRDGSARVTVRRSKTGTRRVEQDRGRGEGRQAGRAVLRTLAPDRDGGRPGARRIPDRRRAERRKVSQRSHARLLHLGRDSRPGCRRQLLQALGGAGPSGSVPVFMRDLGHGLLAGGAHAC